MTDTRLDIKDINVSDILMQVEYCGNIAFFYPCIVVKKGYTLLHHHPFIKVMRFNTFGDTIKTRLYQQDLEIYYKLNLRDIWYSKDRKLYK